mmetsp:Transcript_47088/g.143049  ORF Transcript_47088/g.143049 Transcript_47088/m.143049 type:complete len:243 (-) Transcript_47088:1989-2717(-)
MHQQLILPLHQLELLINLRVAVPELEGYQGSFMLKCTQPVSKVSCTYKTLTRTTWPICTPSSSISSRPKWPLGEALPPGAATLTMAPKRSTVETVPSSHWSKPTSWNADRSSVSNMLTVISPVLGLTRTTRVRTCMPACNCSAMRSEKPLTTTASPSPPPACPAIKRCAHTSSVSIAPSAQPSRWGACTATYAPKFGMTRATSPFNQSPGDTASNQDRSCLRQPSLRMLSASLPALTHSTLT